MPERRIGAMTVSTTPLDWHDGISTGCGIDR